MIDAELGDELMVRLEPWRVTEHGANPWTAAALWNVVRHLAWYERAISLCRGKLSSCYRCPSVNAAVHGSKNSLHIEGLACDIAPGGGWTARRAVAEVWPAVLEGKLGDVREVILEPSWVHIGWRRAHESMGAKLMHATQGGYHPLRL